MPFLAPVLPPGTEIQLSAKVLGFLGLAAALTGIFIGIVPLLRRSRLGSREQLAESPSASPSLRGRRLWGRLVAAQLALSFVLLVGVGLMLRSYRELAGRHLGFDPSHVLTFEAMMNKRLYPSQADRLAFVRRTLERLSGIPGVVTAAASIGTHM